MGRQALAEPDWVVYDHGLVRGACLGELSMGAPRIAWRARVHLGRGEDQAPALQLSRGPRGGQQLPYL
eukprot:3422894-Pyramimonas_sp.AAC.1